MVSGRLSAGTSLGTSARAWSSWFEAGRELSRELPNTSGNACAINAPARSTLECRRALSARPWVAAAYSTGGPRTASCQPSGGALAGAWSWPSGQQLRQLHLASAGIGRGSSSSGTIADSAPPTLSGEEQRNPAVTELGALAQDWRRHAQERRQHPSSSSSSISNGRGACSSGLAGADTAPAAPHSPAVHHIPVPLIERTCTLLDKQLMSKAFAAAPGEPRRTLKHASRQAGAASHGGSSGGASGGGGGANGGRAAARTASAEALADIISSVASCYSCGSRPPPPRPPPPDLARSLLSAATYAADTAPWPQAAVMLQGMVRMRNVGKRFLGRLLTRVQRMPPGPELSTAALSTAAAAAASPALAEMEAGPGAEDTISLLRSLSVLHALLPSTSAECLGAPMQRLMLHLQARLHALPGPAPLPGLLRDVTWCGWRHDREPEFMRRVADYLCTRMPPEAAAASLPAPLADPGAADATPPAALPYGDGDDEAVLARPPRLLALTPSQVVEVLDLYARAGVHHTGLMERGMDAVDSCLPCLTPSQAARVAEACARFYHHRSALMRRLALHVAGHLELPGPPPSWPPRLPKAQAPPSPRSREVLVRPPHEGLEPGQLPRQGAEVQMEAQARAEGQPSGREPQPQAEEEVWLPLRPPGGLPVAPVDVAAAVASLARCRVREERSLGVVAAYATAHVDAVLAEVEGAQAKARPQARVRAREQTALPEERCVVGAGEPPAAATLGPGPVAAGEHQRPVPGGEEARVLAVLPEAGSRSNATGGPAMREEAPGPPLPPPSPCGSALGTRSGLIGGGGSKVGGSRQAAAAAAETGNAGAGWGCGESSAGRLQACGAGGPAAEGALGLGRNSAGGVSAALPDAASQGCQVTPASPAPGPTPGTHLSGPQTGLTAGPGAEGPLGRVSSKDAAPGQQPSGLGAAVEVEMGISQTLSGVASPEADGDVAQLEAFFTLSPPPPAPPEPAVPVPLPEEPGGLRQLADGSPARAADGQRLSLTEPAVSLGASSMADSAEQGPTETAAGGEAATGAGRCSMAASVATAGGNAEPSPVARHVSLERLAPDRTALAIKGLSPALPPRELLDALLREVPGADIDLYYMPYDYAAVSRGRPGQGFAYACVSSAEGVAALARRLQAGTPVCRGAEHAVLEYLPHADSDALLPDLLDPGSGFRPRREDPAMSRPLLLYLSGALRGKVQPLDPHHVELHELRGVGRHHTARPQHAAFNLPHPQHQQHQHQQQADQQLQQQNDPRHQQERLALSPPLAGCGDADVGATPGSSRRTAAPPAPIPEPSPPHATARQRLDPPQLALIAHSMAVLSYHPPGMLAALGQLMARLLQPVLQDPRLALALLPPAANAAAPGPDAAPKRDGADGGRLPLQPQRHCLRSWAALPPLKSVLQSLHALASQPQPDPAVCAALAEVCASALFAWVPRAARDDDAVPPDPAGPAFVQLIDALRVDADRSTASVVAAAALPPLEVLDVHVRLLAQVLAATADRGELLYHPRLCDAAAALLRHRLRHLRVRAACALLQPLVRLHHPSAARLVAAAAPLLTQDTNRLSPASLVDLAWACARTGLRGDGADGDGGGGGRVVGALALRTRQLLPQLPTAGVVQMFWALAVMGYDGATATAGGKPSDLYGQLLQELLQRYDLGARDLLLLQEGMELRRRVWQQRLRRRRPPGLVALADHLTEATEAAEVTEEPDPDPGDLMEGFLRELIYRAGGVEAAADVDAPPPAAAAKPVSVPPPWPGRMSGDAAWRPTALEAAAPARPPEPPPVPGAGIGLGPGPSPPALVADSAAELSQPAAEAAAPQPPLSPLPESRAPVAVTAQAVALPAAPTPHCAGPSDYSRDVGTSLAAVHSNDRVSAVAGGDGDLVGGCGGGRGALMTGAPPPADAGGGAGERAGEGLAAAPGGLLRQVLIARQGLALEEADGVLMRLRVPEALRQKLARASGTVSASAGSS